MTVKHTLIPARGPSYVFKTGDRILLKRGSNIAGSIELKPGVNSNSTDVTYFDVDGNVIRTFNCTREVTKEKLRQYCWTLVYGTAMYLEEKLCPNGAKAIPEKDDDDVPGKYIIWCPTSNLPPRVVLESEKQARAVAHSMAERHGGEFFWCRLHGKVARKAVTTYENVVTRL